MLEMVTTPEQKMVGRWRRAGTASYCSISITMSIMWLAKRTRAGGCG